MKLINNIVMSQESPSTDSLWITPDKFIRVFINGKWETLNTIDYTTIFNTLYELRAKNEELEQKLERIYNSLQEE